MCREKRKLPIGIENFEQIIKDDFYYVDKTGLISELLRNWGMVNLFTRPRRFGKSLNMSMLEHFFSVEGDKSIFDGLKISKDKKLCEEYMGKHPVISISLKGINAASYEAAFELTVKTIKGAVQKAGFLKMSDKLGEDEKKEYRAILDENMSEATLFWSLKNLSELLEKHYETKVILLIDEYDGDDLASIEDNNTSCFNYRPVEGTSSLSKHALGLAIDINPFYNPYITYNKDGSEKVSPANASAYADRTSSFPYKIDENDLCYQLFKEHGFTWGGHWNSCKDYQHFQNVVE